jgi:hypothetical protein
VRIYKINSKEITVCKMYGKCLDPTWPSFCIPPLLVVEAKNCATSAAKYNGFIFDEK